MRILPEAMEALLLTQTKVIVESTVLVIAILPTLFVVTVSTVLFFCSLYLQLLEGS